MRPTQPVSRPGSLRNASTMAAIYSAASMRFDRGAAAAVMLALVAVYATTGAAPQRAAASPGRGTTAAQRTTGHLERIRNEPPALRAFLQAMPKGADLHTHLTGAVYAESYVRWAADLAVCIDTSTFTFVAAAEPAPSGAAPAPPTTCTDAARHRPAAHALQDPVLYRSLIDALSTRHWHEARTAGHYQFFDSFGRFGLVAGGGRETSTWLVGRSVAEVLHRAARQNVLHVELMMSFGAVTGAPAEESWDTDDAFVRARATLLTGGLGKRVAERRRWLDGVEADARAALECGTPSARAGCDVSLRFISYALRGLPPQQVFAQALLAFELAAIDPRVAGVNLVMPEDGYIAMRDYDLHMRMYRFLGQAYPAVNVALHAGELALGLVPPEALGTHVRGAIEIAGARRIGHATDVMHDVAPAKLLRDMARRGIAVEISLSSSDLILGVTGPRHPLRQLLRAGVPIVIATDDEGVARSDLTNEYQRAVQEQGLTYLDIKRISRNSIDHSFVTADAKARMRQRLDAAFAEFEAGH